MAEKLVLPWAEDWAEAIVSHYQQRRVGNTSALVNGVKSWPGARMLVRTEREKESICRVFDLDPKRCIVATESYKLRGLACPIVPDHHFLYELLGGLLQEIGTLRAKILGLS